MGLIIKTRNRRGDFTIAVKQSVERTVTVVPDHCKIIIYAVERVPHSDDLAVRLNRNSARPVITESDRRNNFTVTVERGIKSFHYHARGRWHRSTGRRRCSRRGIRWRICRCVRESVAELRDRQRSIIQNPMIVTLICYPCWKTAVVNQWI